MPFEAMGGEQQRMRRGKRPALQPLLKN